MRPRASSAAANASSVGANTVNGPSPESVSTRPASVTAATRVVKLPAPTATSTMVPGSSAIPSSEVSVSSLVAGISAAFSSLASLPHATASMASASTVARSLSREVRMGIAPVWGTPLTTTAPEHLDATFVLHRGDGCHLLGEGGCVVTSSWRPGQRRAEPQAGLPWCELRQRHQVAGCFRTLESP